MGLRLQIISRQRQSMRAAAVKEFGRDGGTIGRSLQTDWPLPDGQRFLSSHHASIDFHAGSYYIVDTSTNGVFINGSEDPVGKGKPQRLFTGDIVRIGDYEIKVEIDTVENTAETFYDNDHVDPVDAAQRVDSPDPTGHDLIDAFEITGVGLEIMLDEGDADTLTPLAYSFDTSDLALESEAPAQPARPQAAVKTKPTATARPEKRQPAATPTQSAPARAGNAKPVATPATQKRPSPQQTPQNRQPSKQAAQKQPSSPQPKATRAQSEGAEARSKPAQVAQPAGSALDAAVTSLVTAFCEGAGIDTKKIRTEDAQQLFRRLGQTFRATLTGVTDALRLRSMQKAHLRQSQTVIQQRDNNLIKFSANANEAISRLLAPVTDEYLDPVESMRDALADLTAHQSAMLKVLPVVFGRYIGQLDPDELEARFAGTSRNRLIEAANKLRYWDLYRDVYLVMSQQADDELPEAFLDMLSEAYEAEVARTKAASEAASLARKVG